MRRLPVVITLLVASTAAFAITHDAENRKSAREREARQEKARKQKEQQMLEALQKCDEAAHQRHPRDRKAREKHYEECATRVTKP
jgi:hypothetical protein